MERFKAKLEPVPHGSHFVVVPAKTADAAGLKYGARVRGTVNGMPFRSSLMKYGGIFHMGVHKATLAAAGAKGGDRVEVAIELDDQPLHARDADRADDQPGLGQRNAALDRQELGLEGQRADAGAAGDHHAPATERYTA